MAICETCGNDYDRADHAEREAIASVLMHAKPRSLLGTAHAMRASL
jgi:hypothetical protein